MKLSASALAAAVLFAGCATSYRPIHRDTMQYHKTGEGTEVEIAYKHNVLSESDNPRYDMKARVAGVSVVAVKIKNNSAKPLNTRDLEFLVGGTQSIPADAARAIAPVRQRTGLYFLYLLMSPLMLYKAETTCEFGSCQQENKVVFPIGLVLGGGLTLLNAGMSSASNGALHKEIGGNDLYGKTIEAGQEVSGYLVFRDVGNGPVSARLRTSAPMQPPQPNPAADADNAGPANPGEFK